MVNRPWRFCSVSQFCRKFIPATNQRTDELSNRRALSVEVDFANSLDPREHVIGRLAPYPNELSTNNACDEVLGKVENFLRRRAIQPFAKDRSQSPDESLHFRSERHADVRFPVRIDL